MDCPRCSTSLTATPTAGDPYREIARDDTSPCVSCGGIFVPAQAFADVLGKLNRPGVAARWFPETETLKVATTLLIRCPQCKATMTKCRQRARKLVLYDHCAGCGGMWFDRDELDVILKALAGD